MDAIWCDPKTGLEWGPTGTEPMTWRQAIEWCAEQGDGWRLPTIKELVTIVDYSRYDPAVVEPLLADTALDNYWSSTPNVEYLDNIWYVFFPSGLVLYNEKPLILYVRAVRGGS